MATDVNSDVSIDASSRSLVMLVISNLSEHCMLIRINMETKTVKWGLSWLKLCSFVNSRNISIKLGDKVYISLNNRVKFRTKIPMHCCNINKSRRGDFFGSPGTSDIRFSQLTNKHTMGFVAQLAVQLGDCCSPCTVLTLCSLTRIFTPNLT